MFFSAKNGNPLLIDVHLQFEKRCSQLQKKHMRQSVFVNEKNSFHASSHADLVEFIPHPLKSCWYRRIFLEQWLFRSESIVCQRISMINELYSSVRAQSFNKQTSPETKPDHIFFWFISFSLPIKLLRLIVILQTWYLWIS